MENEDDLRERIHNGLVEFVKDNYANDKDLLGVIHDVITHHTSAIHKFMIMMEPVPDGIRQAMAQRAGLDLENIAIMGYAAKVVMTLLRHQIQHGSFAWDDPPMRRDQILHALESVNEELKQVHEKAAAERRA